MNQVNVVILGCGLSGMLTALSFAKIGIKSIIIENKSVESIEFFNDIRTTALTPYSKEFLNNLEIWSKLKEFTSKMLDVYVVDNKNSEILHLKNEKNILGYVVKNADFKKILLSKIQNNSLISLMDKCTYDKIESHDSYSVITLDNNKKINCDLLLICDGLNSKARVYYFSDEIQKSYQTALTFDIKHKISHENSAMEHFLPLGPFALLPLKDHNKSSVIWSTSQNQAKLLMTLPVPELEYLVQRNCGKSLGSINIDSSISAFPLKARVANRYFHNRIVLVADSAHIVHPLAGQGLNQGIKDIEILSQLISGSGIQKEILKEYQLLRCDDNLIMYNITDCLNNVFSNYSKGLHCLRTIGFKAINNLSPIKNLITNYAMGKR